MARGNFEVSMEWEGGTLTQGKIICKSGGILKIQAYQPLQLSGGESADSEVVNPLNEGVNWRKSYFKKGNGAAADRKIYSYSLKTKPGEIILVKALNK